jgi:glycosyltransferase involved in cell wall biosynthesis
MIRVLHVVPDLVPYGLENMVAGLASALDRRRFEPAVASLYAESRGGLEPALRSAGVRLYHLGKRRGLDVRMYPRLRRVLRDFRPHILHTHNYVLRYTYPVALAARVPAMIHTLHSVADREVDRAGQWLNRFAFRRNVRAVAISGEVSASFLRTYGFSEAALIPNGIALDPYRESAGRRTASRRALGLRSGEFAFLCVARFAVPKDHPTLLEAFSRGPGLRPHTRLLLAGDGALRAQTEELAARLGIQGRVTFLGRRTDLPDVLAAADAAVLSSRWEGSPLSIMEAMAAGRPVVASAVGGIPELVRNGEDGFLVPPADPAAMADAMCRLCDCAAADLAAMGRAAAERAGERFGLAAMVRSYAEFYHRALPGGRPEDRGALVWAGESPALAAVPPVGTGRAPVGRWQADRPPHRAGEFS